MKHEQPNDYDQEMHPDEFTRATFFSTEAELAALGPAKAPQPPKRKRRGPGLRALARFARALEAEHHDSRRAAILWLADRYLGMKPRDWWK